MQDFMLTDMETEVLVELLRIEAHQLQNEVNHTSTHAMKEKLQDRLRIVYRLIERFEELGEPINAL
ncbi:MAG TPA: hypothetical protein VL282_07580 [Tepidisphaeraceae bacterium]|jgi:hypothetical protein|nr:hypothetical protein [Tepidisphaeraceae bacterium]